MIPSRQQAAQGPYGPLLTAGLYPTGPAAAAPVAASTAPQSAGSMVPVPAAPVSAASPAPAPPLSVGSLSMDGDSGGESAPSTPSPDQSFGGLMNALGTAASIGLGGPFGFAGALGALGLSNALSQPPSFNLSDVLAGLTAPSTQDMTVGGLASAPPGTGASISTGGLEPAGPDGKAGEDFGGHKGGGDLGTDPGKGEPGTAPNGGEKGDAPSGDSGPGGTGGPGPGGEGGTGVGGEPGDGGMYMQGGYTGEGADGVVDPSAEAGTVHEGEVVIPAHMVKHYGLDLLMGLVSGEVPKNRLAQIAGMGGMHKR